MVSRGKAIKTVIAGGVGVAVVGLSVDAAWPSDPGLRAVPDHQQLVSRPMSTAWPASWLDTTPPTPNITQSSAPVSPGVLAPVKAATPTPSPAVSKVAMPTGVLLSKPLNGPVTSPFGMRFHPILHVWKLHTGVDFVWHPDRFVSTRKGPLRGPCGRVRESGRGRSRHDRRQARLDDLQPPVGDRRKGGTKG